MEHPSTYFDRVVFLEPQGGRTLSELDAELRGLRWPFGRAVQQVIPAETRWVPPEEWRASAGEWTRLQAHARILEDALTDYVYRLLVVEPRVRFEPGLAERWAEVTRVAQGRWSVLLFQGGKGQPLAYAVQGDALPRLYRSLRSLNPRHTIEDRLFQLRQNARRGDVSLVRAPGTTRATPFIAVIGLHRSGSSCLAGVLHHLGVYLGDRLGGYERTGGFEAHGLATLCERALPFPTTEWRQPRPEVRAGFEAFARRLQARAAAEGRFAGGKYPHLCAMGDVLEDVLGPALSVVHIDRPLDASIRSLHDREKGRLSLEQAEAVQTFLWEQKQRFLERTPHHRVDFAALRADPRAVIEDLVRDLGLQPSEAQLERAIAHVDPDLAVHDRKTP